LIVLVLALSLLGSFAAAQGLRVVTEEWAPFNYLDKGSGAGMAVELVQAMLADAGIVASIEFLPWNRAYELAQKTPNVLIFTMGRNADREALFDWLFRIAPREIWLIKLAKKSELTLSSLEEAKKYLIGTGPKEDATTQELVKAGFVIGKNLDSVTTGDPDKTTIQKLFAKRNDLIAGNPVSLAYSAKSLGYDFSETAKVLRLSGENPGYWSALSLKSDPVLRKRLADSVAKLEKTGLFKSILDKYLK